MYGSSGKNNARLLPRDNRDTIPYAKLVIFSLIEVIEEYDF